MINFGIIGPLLAKILFELAVQLEEQTGADIKFINLSGGIGIPYKPDQEANDIKAIGEGVRQAYEEVLTPAGMGDVAIYTELGRYMMGDIVIDKSAHMVTIDGNVIELSYKEFELLTYFAENQGIALSREKILNNVWNYDYYGDARTIDTHVKKLRSKLGEKGGEYIKTIWGMGYKFEV